MKKFVSYIVIYALTFNVGLFYPFISFAEDATYGSDQAADIAGGGTGQNLTEYQEWTDQNAGTVTEIAPNTFEFTPKPESVTETWSTTNIHSDQQLGIDNRIIEENVPLIINAPDSFSGDFSNIDPSEYEIVGNDVIFNNPQPSVPLSGQAQTDQVIAAAFDAAANLIKISNPQVQARVVAILNQALQAGDNVKDKNSSAGTQAVMNILSSALQSLNSSTQGTPQNQKNLPLWMQNRSGQSASQRADNQVIVKALQASLTAAGLTAAGKAPAQAPVQGVALTPQVVVNKPYKSLPKSNISTQLQPSSVQQANINPPQSVAPKIFHKNPALNASYQAGDIAAKDVLAKGGTRDEAQAVADLAANTVIKALADAAKAKTTLDIDSVTAHAAPNTSASRKAALNSAIGKGLAKYALEQEKEGNFWHGVRGLVDGKEVGGGIDGYTQTEKQALTTKYEVDNNIPAHRSLLKFFEKNPDGGYQDIQQVIKRGSSAGNVRTAEPCAGCPATLKSIMYPCYYYGRWCGNAVVAAQPTPTPTPSAQPKDPLKTASKLGGKNALKDALKNNNKPPEPDLTLAVVAPEDLSKQSGVQQTPPPEAAEPQADTDPTAQDFRAAKVTADQVDAVADLFAKQGKGGPKIKQKIGDDLAQYNADLEMAARHDETKNLDQVQDRVVGKTSLLNNLLDPFAAMRDANREFNLRKAERDSGFDFTAEVSSSYIRGDELSFSTLNYGGNLVDAEKARFQAQRADARRATDRQAFEIQLAGWKARKDYYDSLPEEEWKPSSEGYDISMSEFLDMEYRNSDSHSFTETFEYTIRHGIQDRVAGVKALWNDTSGTIAQMPAGLKKFFWDMPTQAYQDLKKNAKAMDQTLIQHVLSIGADIYEDGYGEMLGKMAAEGGMALAEMLLPSGGSVALKTAGVTTRAVGNAVRVTAKVTGQTAALEKFVVAAQKAATIASKAKDFQLAKQTLQSSKQGAIKVLTKDINPVTATKNYLKAKKPTVSQLPASGQATIKFNNKKPGDTVRTSLKGKLPEDNTYTAAWGEPKRSHSVQPDQPRAGYSATGARATWNNKTGTGTSGTYSGQGTKTPTVQTTASNPGSKPIKKPYPSYTKPVTGSAGSSGSARVTWGDSVGGTRTAGTGSSKTYKVTGKAESTGGTSGRTSGNSWSFKTPHKGNTYTGTRTGKQAYSSTPPSSKPLKVTASRKSPVPAANKVPVRRGVDIDDNIISRRAGATPELRGGSSSKQPPSFWKDVGSDIKTGWTNLKNKVFGAADNTTGFKKGDHVVVTDPHNPTNTINTRVHSVGSDGRVRVVDPTHSNATMTVMDGQGMSKVPKPGKLSSDGQAYVWKDGDWRSGKASGPDADGRVLVDVDGTKVAVSQDAYALGNAYHKAGKPPPQPRPELAPARPNITVGEGKMKTRGEIVIESGGGLEDTRFVIHESQPQRPGRPQWERLSPVKPSPPAASKPRAPHPDDITVGEFQQRPGTKPNSGKVKPHILANKANPGKSRMSGHARIGSERPQSTYRGADDFDRALRHFNQDSPKGPRVGGEEMARRHRAARDQFSDAKISAVDNDAYQAIKSEFRGSTKNVYDAQGRAVGFVTPDNKHVVLTRAPAPKPTVPQKVAVAWQNFKTKIFGSKKSSSLSSKPTRSGDTHNKLWEPYLAPPEALPEKFLKSLRKRMNRGQSLNGNDVVVLQQRGWKLDGKGNLVPPKGDYQFSDFKPMKIKQFKLKSRPMTVEETLAALPQPKPKPVAPSKPRVLFNVKDPKTGQPIIGIVEGKIKSGKHVGKYAVRTDDGRLVPVPAKPSPLRADGKMKRQGGAVYLGGKGKSGLSASRSGTNKPKSDSRAYGDYDAEAVLNDPTGPLKGYQPPAPRRSVLRSEDGPNTFPPRKSADAQTAGTKGGVDLGEVKPLKNVTSPQRKLGDLPQGKPVHNRQAHELVRTGEARDVRIGDSDALGMLDKDGNIVEVRRKLFDDVSLDKDARIHKRAEDLIKTGQVPEGMHIALSDRPIKFTQAGGKVVVMGRADNSWVPMHNSKGEFIGYKGSMKKADGSTQALYVSPEGKLGLNPPQKQSLWNRVFGKKNLETKVEVFDRETSFDDVNSGSAASSGQ